LHVNIAIAIELLALLVEHEATEGVSALRNKCENYLKQLEALAFGVGGRKRVHLVGISLIVGLVIGLFETDSS